MTSKTNAETKEKKNTNNKNKSNVIRKKCLYTCKTVLDINEFKKTIRYFNLYWYYVICGTLANFILLSIITIFFNNPVISSVIAFFIIEVFILIVYKVGLEKIEEKRYIRNQNKIDLVYQIKFYNEYFIKQGDKVIMKYYYTDINKVIETDTDLYLTTKDNKVIIIQKNTCKTDITTFIYSKCNSIEKHINNKHNEDINKLQKYQNVIKILMIILFIITLLSWYLASALCIHLCTIYPLHGFNLMKNNWAYFCLLPVPILSIILGYKFNKIGIKCKKNIVAGFIMCFILIFSGFPYFIENSEKKEEYKEIYKYQNIINLQLPNNGEIDIYNWGPTSMEDMDNYREIFVYYDNEDVAILEKDIENNPNWFLYTEIKSNLKIMIPIILSGDNDAYYCIYNNTTNQYNALPNEPGVYEIYAMKYDQSNKELDIHIFDYTYR